VLVSNAKSSKNNKTLDIYAINVKIVFVEIFLNMLTYILRNLYIQEQLRNSNALYRYCERELFTYYKSNVARKKLQRAQKLLSFFDNVKNTSL